MWGKSTMYEESAGSPMIAAGPGIPQGKVCDTPVTLADAFPTIVQSVGLPADPRDAELPGVSLTDIANGKTPARTILSEYHAAGAITGSYMIRNGKWKFVYYVGQPPMLFDLAADPHETKDLGRDPAHQTVIAECEAKLRTVVDPEAADKLARADQAAKIASVGGKEAIFKKGHFRYSPPPGSEAKFFEGEHA
jgi:choline-sulfatase